MTARRLILALATVAATACGGSSAPGSTQPVTPPAGQGVVVVTSPASADVEPGMSVKFGATVTGTADTGVTWTVSEPDGGTIDATGLYTAPSTEGTYHVVATSTATQKSAGNSVVKVKKSQGHGAVSVAVDPAAATVPAGGSLTFSATVTGSTVGAVDWTVQEGSSCGAVTSAGVYTAPATAATCHVVATAQADATRSAAATVTVTPAITVAITPTTATLDACKGLVFTAAVGNASNTSVTWSVLEAGGGSVTNGIYTAPRTSGTYHVVATSAADPTKSVQATVTVGAEKVVSVAVAPGSGTLQPDGQLAFAATVTTTCGTFPAQ